MTPEPDPPDLFVSRPAWSLPGRTPDDEVAPVVPPSTTEERFALRAEIGSGGMGRVTLFRDEWLGRLVAVKEPATEADARRLWREALVTARLEHPGIVPIYDLGVGANGTPWFAMRVVRGRSLAEILKAEPGPHPELLRPLLAVCEAVGFAHRQGIVHRDLKPANLMAGAFGEMQVIDWGLAQAEDLPEADVGSAGTLAYMSPEQARGEPVAPTADVWSLGAVLYEVTTGMPARARADDHTLLAPARRGVVDAIPASVPPELAAVLQRALAADAAARYPDAKALADDLARYLDGQRVTAHRYSTFELLARVVSAWRIPLTIVAVSLVVLVVMAIIGMDRIREERDLAEQNLARSLEREAQAALDDERLIDAQRLASEALVRAQDPALLAACRGVLAAAGTGLPAVEPVAAAPCAPIGLSEEAALCRERGEVSLWERGTRRWSRPIGNTTARFIAGGEVVVVMSPQRTHALSAATGETLFDLPTPCDSVIGSNLTDGGDGRSALMWNRNCLARVTADTITPLPSFLCGEPGAQALAGRPDGVAVACGDGSIRTIDGGGPARFEVGLGTPSRPPMPTALAFVADDEIMVGSADGRLELVALRPTVERRVLASQRGLIRAIDLTPSRGLAFVRADGSAPLVLDLERRSVLMRLPDLDISGATFDAEGRLLVALRGSRATAEPATRIERWDLAGLRPRRMPFADGVTVVAVSANGDRIGVGDGAALVLLDDQRRVVARHRWQDSIIKTLGFDRDGLAVAHGQRLMDVRSFDDGRAVGLYRTPESIWRRVAVLADGTIVGANHLHQVFVMRRDTAWVELASGPVVDLVASRDGQDIALLGEDGAIRCGFGFAQRRALEPCARGDGGRALALEGRRLYVLEEDAVRALDLAAPGDPGKGVVYHAPRGDLVSIASGGDLIAAGSRGGSLWIWRVGDPAPVATVHVHATRVDSLAFGPDARWLVSGGWDGHISFVEPRALDDRRARIHAALADGD